MSNDTKYVFTSGDCSVLWHKEGFDVVQSRNGAGYVDCTFAADADGLGLAIMRARYKSGEGLTHNREARRAEVSFCTEEGKRIFALGIRKAHAEWLDA